MSEGYLFLSVKSAEGRRAPGNVHITEAEYEADRLRILEAINAKVQP